MKLVTIEIVVDDTFDPEAIADQAVEAILDTCRCRQHWWQFWRERDGCFWVGMSATLGDIDLDEEAAR